MTQKELSILPDGRTRPPTVAHQIGVSEKTLATMRCSGTGPPYTKIRGRIYYYQDDINEWLQSHPKQVSTAQNR